MPLRLLYLLLLIWPLTACQWAAQQFFLPREGVRLAEHSVTIQRHVIMKTADNVALAADVFLPSGATKSPTILVRIPYTKTLGNQIRSEAVARFWASRGYAVVIQGTRGRYESGGQYYPLINERQDGIETLRWIAQQPWYNGRLGMWGGSVFGYTQWAIADQSDPGPAALDIQISSTDFYGMFYAGGAFALESALYWAIRSHGTEDIDPTLDNLERGVNGFPLIEADDRAMVDVPFFNDWVTHRERDDYWLSIDGIDRARHIKAPALLMAGWFDPFLPTQIRDFIQIRNEAEHHVATNTRLIIGPWSHADTVTLPGEINAGDYRQASLAPSIDWFDRHLMGRNIQATAPVRIFVMGDNMWRDEQEWPLTRAKSTPYYLSSSGGANSLRGDGHLTAHAPNTQSTDHYSYDPLHPVPSRGGAMLGPRAGIAIQNEIEARQDVLVYTSAALEADIEATGNVEVVLYVSTTAPNTDFYAKLVDVHPDGTAYNVSDGIIRQDYPPTSSPHYPRQITIQLWPTSMVFKKEHRIRLEITSSNYPRHDRNPNTGQNISTSVSTNIATQSVYHGGVTPSRLILPIVPR